MNAAVLIGNEVARFLEQARTENLKRSSYLKSYRGLNVVLSFGQGRTAEIPWMGFFDVGQKPSQGIYPALLYYKMHNLLLLAYGISETHPPAASWNVQGQLTIGQFFMKRNLEPKRYSQSLVYRSYSVGEIVFEDLEDDINRLIDEYREQLGSIAKK